MTEYRSVQSATSSTGSDTDVVEQNEMLKDKHSGMLMNSTHNVRHVELNAEKLKEMFNEDEKNEKDGGMEFTTTTTGETETETKQIDGYFDGDGVARTEG